MLDINSEIDVAPCLNTVVYFWFYCEKVQIIFLNKSAVIFQFDLTDFSQE